MSRAGKKIIGSAGKAGTRIPSTISGDMRISRVVVSLIFVVFVLHGLARCQGAAISGTVLDAETAEPLTSATFLIRELLLGTSSDSLGEFALQGIPPGEYSIRVSMAGYAPFDTMIALAIGRSLNLVIGLIPDEAEMEEVVITGTRTVRTIADAPVRVEAIPQEEVEEKLLMTPSNVAMLLNESTGMRVQTTSATSNTANLRIQGLNGRYTQILIDGVPTFSGLAAGFGLTQLAPLNLRQVEVIKGATSSLYGADAIAGVVNFLTKVPGDEPELSAILNATSQKGFDGASFYSQRLGATDGFTIFMSRNLQGLFDVDGDAYADIARYERFSLSPKFVASLSQNVEARIAGSFLTEHRFGGRMDAPELGGGSDDPYREEIQTERFEVGGHVEWRISTDQSLSLNIATMHLERDAHYGTLPFNGTQSMIYLDGQYNFRTGDQNILLGIVSNAETFEDRTPSIVRSRSYHFITPAGFVQDEWKVSDEWTILGSGRVDFHNVFGTFLTPRISLMHRPSSQLTLRLAGGTGFKAPTIFVEESEEAGFRNVQPLEGVTAEKAVSGSFDLNWKASIGDDIAATVGAGLYLSSLDGALRANPDSIDVGVLSLQNAIGKTVTRGCEISLKLARSEYKLSLGYTYLYGTEEHRGGTSELALNPRHSVGIVLVWESEEQGAKVGLENYWTGRQRLERNPFRDVSPDYWVTGLIAEKKFGIVRLFVNFENIFDTRQTRFESIINPASGRTVPIYAPLEGRVINGGVRLVL